MADTLSAAQLIGEYLQTPDDLARLSGFRRKLEREKASIDARLRAGVKEQLEATRHGLSQLLSTRDNIQAIRDEMALIHEKCEDPLLYVDTFDQMSRVSIAHRNFESTEEMVSNLYEMTARLDQIEHMLATDRTDLLGPAPDLLLIHHCINMLDRFRSETMVEARKASQVSRDTLTRWFERLDGAIAQFDEYFGELTQNILPLVEAGHADVVVRLLKIADFEGKEDEKSTAMRFAMKAAPFRFRAAQANPRPIKNYREKIMASITKFINEKMEAFYEEKGQDPLQFLQKLGWLYKDIRRVERQVVPCFPPDYNIYSHYVREYHRSLHTIVKRIAETKLEGSALLGLYEWITKHYKGKMSKAGVPLELLHPPLLDGQEQELIEDYLKLIIQRLDEWTANLMKTEIATFTKRDGPPETDGEGIFCTQGSFILFQMVNQQIDLAIDCGQSAVLVRVVDEVNRVMCGIQDQWTRTLDSEFKKKPDETALGLTDYCIALANDQVRSAEYTEGLLARLKAYDEYQDLIQEPLNDAFNGYVDVAKKCTQALINAIFMDIKPATEVLFQPSWYDDGVQLIVGTIRDYMGDYQAYLHPTLLDPLIEELLDTFLLVYLNAFAATARLRMPSAAQRMKEDVEEVSALFSDLAPDNEGVVARLGVLGHVQAMLDASADLFLLSYWPFAKEHGPNLVFVENLIEAREDLREKSEILETIKERVEDEGITDPATPTTMAKVVLPGLMSRAATAATRLLRS